METLVVRSASEVREAISHFTESAAVGCDTETTGLDPKKNRLLSIQFSDGHRGVLVPVNIDGPPANLSSLLADASITKIFHNARFDLGFLNACGFRTQNVFDTMIAEKVLTRGANQSVSLAETLYRYFAVDLDKSQRQKFGRNWNGVWTDALVEYAMNDVIFLPELMNQQVSWLKRLGLESEYREQIDRILRPPDR